MGENFTKKSQRAYKMLSMVEILLSGLENILSTKSFYNNVPFESREFLQNFVDPRKREFVWNFASTESHVCTKTSEFTIIIWNQNDTRQLLAITLPHLPTGNKSRLRFQFNVKLSK